jgi:hypothetical protein
MEHRNIEISEKCGEFFLHIDHVIRVDLYQLFEKPVNDMGIESMGM